MTVGESVAAVSYEGGVLISTPSDLVINATDELLATSESSVSDNATVSTVGVLGSKVNTNATVTPRRLRNSAIRSAEQIASALKEHADVNRISMMAVGIDQRRLATILNFDTESFRDHQRISRGLNYAARLGLISILCHGRPRSGRQKNGEHETGIPGLYAVFDTHADPEAISISEEQKERLRVMAFRHIDGRERLRNRVSSYFEKVSAFDSLHGKSKLQ